MLSDITSNILKTASTFTAPTVAVNAFNRTQTLNDLYVSVFEPSTNYHWPGNVKKYGVTNGVITDAGGQPAVDPNLASSKTAPELLVCGAGWTAGCGRRRGQQDPVWGSGGDADP